MSFGSNDAKLSLLNMTEQDDSKPQVPPEPPPEGWGPPPNRQPRGYLYTPSQVGFLTFLFGPLAGVWILKTNFDVLGKPEYSKRTIINGIGATLFLFVCSLLLNRRLPTYIIQMCFSLFAAFVVRRFQLTREGILASQEFAIESSWKGLKVGLAATLVSLVLFGLLIAIFYSVGLVSLP